MNVDFEALITLTTEKSIPVLSIIEGIEQEVISLYRELPEARPHARVRVDRETGEIHIWVPTFNE
jgi:N utilization substance protein A